MLNSILHVVVFDALNLQPKLDIIPYRSPGQESIFLEYHAPVHTRPFYWLAKDFQFASRDFYFAGSRVQECGFPTAAWANNHDKFTLFDIQGEVVQG